MDTTNNGRPRRRATSADVAALAGVSRATVSYVLNRSTRHSIPEATRERVLAAAAELGYTPHAAAAALRRGDSGIILMIIGDVPFSENLDTLVSEMTAGISALGRSLVLWRASAGQPLAGILQHVAPVLALTTMPLSPDDAAALEAAGVRVVDPELGSTDDVTTREHTVGQVQVEHLVERGHRRLAVLTTDDPRLQGFAAGRAAGALGAAAAAGLPEPLVGRVPLASEADLPGLGDLLAGWCSGPDPVTAVCAYNDVYAGMVERAAIEAGLRVPDDLSVIGVDDDQYAAFLPVPLTTVRYDFPGYAAFVMERLRAALDGLPGPRRPSAVLMTVVERASVRPLTP